MHRDEGELEAAGEESKHQHDIGRMGEGLGESLAQRLRRRPAAGGGRIRRDESERQRQHHQYGHREDEQCLLPAERIHQHDAERREQELAERAGGSAEAEGDRAVLQRQQLGKGRQDHHERGAGKAEADQGAGRHIERQRAGRMRHQRQTCGVHQSADAEHARRAVTVGDDAGDRLADAPEQVLQRQGESEDVAAPVIGARHRRQEEAHRRARTERHQRDQAAEADDQRRRAPAGQTRRWSAVAHDRPALEVLRGETISGCPRRQKRKILIRR